MLSEEEGLKTTVLPVIIAPTLIPVDIDTGKLKGAITPKTPYGFMLMVTFSALDGAPWNPSPALTLLSSRVVFLM